MQDAGACKDRSGWDEWSGWDDDVNRSWVADDVYPDTYGPWRVCCRCLERIGDPDDDGFDVHGGICSSGMVFVRCWTWEGLCHFHGGLKGPACRDLRCRAETPRWAWRDCSV